MIVTLINFAVLAKYGAEISLSPSPLTVYLSIWTANPSVHRLVWR